MKSNRVSEEGNFNVAPSRHRESSTVRAPRRLKAPSAELAKRVSTDVKGMRGRADVGVLVLDPDGRLAPDAGALQVLPRVHEPDRPRQVLGQVLGTAEHSRGTAGGTAEHGRSAGRTGR